MLQVNKPSSEINRGYAEAESSPAQTLTSYVDIVRRQFPTIVAIVSACVILGLLYLFTAAPQFTSTASMVIDTRKVQLFQQQSVLGDIAVDSATVETQVEILKSENISLAVIRDLHLIDDPEFTGSGGGVFSAVLGFVGSLFSDGHPPSEFEQTRKALERFEKNRTVKRLNQTYVMEIGFTSRDPAKAAQTANAIADAYIVDQLEAKYQATRRASVWLQDRIKELRTQASAAQKAVVDFKTANNIVDTGGRLMNEQQLAEVNSQLIMAHASTAEAKARLDRMNDIQKQDVPDANVADALKNDTIVKLRGQYVDMASKESIWSMKYGSDHLAAVNLRRQMAEIKKNIQDELKRIQESYKSDYDIAVTREESIKSSLANVVSESQLTNQAQVQLRELDSNAQSYQAMYDNFLQRYMESVQQQSFPITEARVISAATTPLVKSYPKSPAGPGGEPVRWPDPRLRRGDGPRVHRQGVPHHLAGGGATGRELHRHPAGAWGRNLSVEAGWKDAWRQARQEGQSGARSVALCRRESAVALRGGRALGKGSRRPKLDRAREPGAGDHLDSAERGQEHALDQSRPAHRPWRRARHPDRRRFAQPLAFARLGA
ncbi:uncharacterized protein involved in exopolysaccharide biosynthesis [Bradyrhizobium sp. GM2.4]